MAHKNVDPDSDQQHWIFGKSSTHYRYPLRVTTHLIVRCGEDGGDGVLADGSDGQVLLLLLLLLLFLPAAMQLNNYS